MGQLSEHRRAEQGGDGGLRPRAHVGVLAREAVDRAHTAGPLHGGAAAAVGGGGLLGLVPGTAMVLLRRHQHLILLALIVLTALLILYQIDLSCHMSFLKLWCAAIFLPTVARQNGGEEDDHQAERRGRSERLKGTLDSIVKDNEFWIYSR